MDKQKFVYIVTDGDYSDYHICAVFDSRELAQKFVGKYSHYEYARIEEYEINPYKVALKDNIGCYKVTMTKSGNVLCVSNNEPFDDGFDNAKIEYSYGTWFCGKDRSEQYMQTSMFAKDKNHAIKIANERRAMAIANNEWIDR